MNPALNRLLEWLEKKDIVSKILPHFHCRGSALQLDEQPCVGLCDMSPVSEMKLHWIGCERLVLCLLYCDMKVICRYLLIDSMLLCFLSGLGIIMPFSFF